MRINGVNFEKITFYPLMRNGECIYIVPISGYLFESSAGNKFVAHKGWHSFPNERRVVQRKSGAYYISDFASGIGLNDRYENLSQVADSIDELDKLLLKGVKTVNYFELLEKHDVLVNEYLSEV